MDVLGWIGDGLWNAFRMAWEVGWALILGFALSGIVQAWIPRSRMQSALGARDLRTVSLATGLGAASSSCSYAAVAIAKSMLQKGASLVSAMAFQFASTNLVFELGIVIWIFLGWEFTLAELVGGVLLIAFMWAGLQALRHAQPRGGGAHGTRSRRRPGTSTTRPAPEGLTWRERLTSVDSVVGRRAQLPRRLGDALEGDRRRVPDRRLRRAPADGLLQRALPHGRARLDPDPGERDRGAARRRPLVRVLDRQRAAGGRALGRWDLVLGRDRVHLRRPARDPDPAHLPEVLRDEDRGRSSRRSCSARSSSRRSS